ncbi:MAG: hypothetical protein ACU837_09350 [Gammaproteobacteria bacterium]
MATCCNDPTEPPKIDRRDLLREQELYGNLLRDLYTGNPELVLLKQLQNCNTYLKELAALRAPYDSVRKQAIAMLDEDSKSTLERIAKQEADNLFGTLARQRLQEF